MYLSRTLRMNLLFDGLPHTVQVKRVWFAVRAGGPEQFDGFCFGRSREGEEGEIGLWPSGFGHGR